MRMPSRGAGGVSYRYGFNGQEAGHEIKGIGNSYTAEFWEYDSRIGKRWNLDVVEKAWVSGYSTLGNNPLVMIDPDGADWYRNNTTKEAMWFEGKGKHKGYTYVGAENQVIFKGKDLDAVIVTAKSKRKVSDRVYLAWKSHMSPFSHTAAEAAQWKIDRANFEKGNYNSLSPAQIAMYKRWDQADKEWRQMSLGAVGLMAAPIAAVGLVETGAGGAIWNGGRWIFQRGISEGRLVREGAVWLGRKYGRSFITEVGINYLQNGMDIRKMDAFDIFTNTLNPFRTSLRGRVLMGGVNSLVDINLFAEQGQRLSYLGNGKSFGQVGIDFSFGFFNEGIKYTFGALGGSNAKRDFVLEIMSGCVSGQVQNITIHGEK
jgi:hypothetical protein